MKQRQKSLPSVLGLALMLALTSLRAHAASPAASACPPRVLLSANLAHNANFDVPDAGVPLGSQTCWQSGDPVPPPAAADSWFMHSDNAGARVCSRLVPTTTPGPSGPRMLRVAAGGGEGGVYQNVALDPHKSYLFSVWVFVRTGQVVIQSHTTTGGPVAWSTTQGQWEQLRVCTNALSSTNVLGITNQDLNGGVFFVDRVELHEIPTVE